MDVSLIPTNEWCRDTEISSLLSLVEALGKSRNQPSKILPSSLPFHAPRMPLFSGPRLYTVARRLSAIHRFDGVLWNDISNPHL